MSSFRWLVLLVTCSTYFVQFTSAYADPSFPSELAPNAYAPPSADPCLGELKIVCLNDAEFNDKCSRIEADACVNKFDKCTIYMKDGDCAALPSTNPSELIPLGEAPANSPIDTPAEVKALCLFHHELMHSTEPCSITTCAGEGIAYGEQEECSKKYFEQLCSGSASDPNQPMTPACMEILGLQCRAASQRAFADCQCKSGAKNKSDACQPKCIESCVSEALGCYLQHSLVVKPGAIQAIEKSCYESARLYCKMPSCECSGSEGQSNCAYVDRTNLGGFSDGSWRKVRTETTWVEIKERSCEPRDCNSENCGNICGPWGKTVLEMASSSNNSCAVFKPSGALQSPARPDAPEYNACTGEVSNLPPPPQHRTGPPVVSCLNCGIEICISGDTANPNCIGVVPPKDCFSEIKKVRFCKTSPEGGLDYSRCSNWQTTYERKISTENINYCNS